MQNYFLAALIMFSACAFAPSPTALDVQAATGCVSDPLTGGDDVVPHCPPPSTQQLQAATLSYAQGYAVDHQIADPTYDISGGCGANDHGGITCFVNIRFGGNQHIIVACNSPDDNNSQPVCTAVQD